MWRFISSWLGFYSAVAWQLSWYQNSHQDPILTLQEVLELLASAFECSHWLLCTTPSRQCWVEQVLGSEKVTLENILVYYYTEKSKINHTRCVWNCQGKDGSAFLILSLFFDSYAISIFKAVEAFSWRVCVLLRDVPCHPPPKFVSIVSELMLYFLNSLASSHFGSFKG